MKFIFSTPVLIRHLWQLKTVVFRHWCLILTVTLSPLLVAAKLQIYNSILLRWSLVWMNPQFLSQINWTGWTKSIKFLTFNCSSFPQHLRTGATVIKLLNFLTIKLECLTLRNNTALAYSLQARLGAYCLVVSTLWLIFHLN